MGPVESLNEAIDVLQPGPIEPGSQWYVEPEVHMHSGRKLPPLARLRAQLLRSHAALYGAQDLVAKGGKFGLEFDVFFIKLRQDLSVDEGRRKEFRRFAETRGSVLVELIDALVDDLGTALVHAGLPSRVLVAIDDLEKVEHEEQLREIFESNLGAFLAPRVPILATVPPSLTLGGPGTALGQRVTHLRPIQVLKKMTARDPMSAADPGGLELLRRVLAARVDLSLFEPSVIDEAALYSGGVIRDFFGLLRLAAIQALDLYGQQSVDSVAFDDVLIEETNNLTRTLYPADKEALREIHETHALKGASQLDYMRRSVVLEFNHDGIWWDAAPMLWRWLERA